MKTKYYKVVNPKGHRGLVYKEGYNEDPLPFDLVGTCRPGGIYFTTIKYLFKYLGYGSEVYEVEPVGEVYNEGEEAKAHAVNLTYIGTWSNIEIIKELVELGADIHTVNNFALRYSAEHGHLDVVKYLVEQGADIHAYDDEALRGSACNGHLDVVKYLVELGADIHAYDDDALRYSACNGHLDVVKYLVELGADIHTGDDDALLRYITKQGHLDVVKYLVELGVGYSYW